VDGGRHERRQSGYDDDLESSFHGWSVFSLIEARTANLRKHQAKRLKLLLNSPLSVAYGYSTVF
jgi:hypothetical protein